MQQFLVSIKTEANICCFHHTLSWRTTETKRETQYLLQLFPNSFPQHTDCLSDDQTHLLSSHRPCDKETNLIFSTDDRFKLLVCSDWSSVEFLICALISSQVESFIHLHLRWSRIPCWNDEGDDEDEEGVTDAGQSADFNVRTAAGVSLVSCSCYTHTHTYTHTLTLDISM